MSTLNKKTLIPLCLIAVSFGYFSAEYIVPKYFKPPPSYQIIGTDPSHSNDLISILRMNNYIRSTESGNYLAGKFAQNSKDWKSADKYISKALNKHLEDFEEPTLTKTDDVQPTQNTPSIQQDLKSHSMLLAMSAGEYDKAVKLSYDVFKADPKNILAMLFITADYFKKGQYIEANETLNKVGKDSIASFIVPILSFWSQTIQKDGSINPDITTNNLFPTNLYVYHALLAGIYTDQKEAVENYALKSFNANDLDVRDAEKMADLFYLYGQKEIALGLYQILKDRGFSDDNIATKIQGIENEQSIDTLINLPKIQAPKEGAAIVFSDMAEILIRELSDDSANLFAQIALYLDPTLTRPHLIVSDIYARSDRLDAAIEQLEKISSDSDDYMMAQRQISEFYNAQENDEKAIKILEDIYKKTNDLDALNQIGDIYRYNEDYNLAAQTYTKIINTFDTVPKNYWHVLYARGMSYERLKKFAKAEKDLLAALAFQPEEPYLLNYLGYSWADQGLNLEQALKMIQKAVELKPNDGYIADSLGWVHYKMGNLDFNGNAP